MTSNLSNIKWDSRYSKVFLRWIKECNSITSKKFISFVIDNKIVGAVHQSRMSLFKQYPDIFQVNRGSIVLNSQLKDSELRTTIIGQLMREWNQRGIISGWYDEEYRVVDTFKSEPYMYIERSAASMLGILKFGVHVNGVVHKEDGLYMWIAQRSKGKARFPGKFDQLVAGGIPAHMSAQNATIKECQEEANIPFNLSIQIQPTAGISYCMEENKSLIRDILFVYDLNLPLDFVPINNDGEVEEFFLWPIKKVFDTVINTREFKTNCNLVLIDFFVRYGLIPPSVPHYYEIVQKLKSNVSLNDSFHLIK